MKENCWKFLYSYQLFESVEANSIYGTFQKIQSFITISEKSTPSCLFPSATKHALNLLICPSARYFILQIHLQHLAFLPRESVVTSHVFLNFKSVNLLLHIASASHYSLYCRSIMKMSWFNSASDCCIRDTSLFNPEQQIVRYPLYR